MLTEHDENPISESNSYRLRKNEIAAQDDRYAMTRHIEGGTYFISDYFTHYVQNDSSFCFKLIICLL